MKFFALGLYAAVSFFFLDKWPTVYGDEALFVEPSIHLNQKGNFGTEMYAPIGGAEVSHPFQGRLYTLIQAGALKITGTSVRGMRTLPFLCGLLTLILTYLIALHLFQSEPVALGSALVLALSHVFIFASHFARPDMMVSTFVMLALWLAIKKYPVLAGIVAALAVDVHPPGTIAAVVVLAYQVAAL